MIVITGATGHVGGEAARLLIESGVAVRLLVRDAQRAAHLGAAEVLEGDFGDPQRVADALNPGDRVFMVSLYETHDERMRKHSAFVEAAGQADVAQLAYQLAQYLPLDEADRYAVLAEEEPMQGLVYLDRIVTELGGGP